MTKQPPIKALTKCSGIEALDDVSPTGMLEPSDLVEPRRQHCLSHVLSLEDIEKLPATLQTMAWKAINIKDRMLRKGRIIEAYKDLPGLAREALHFHRSMCPGSEWHG